MENLISCLGICLNKSVKSGDSKWAWCVCFSFLCPPHKTQILNTACWLNGPTVVCLCCFLQAVSSYRLIFHVSAHKPLRAACGAKTHKTLNMCVFSALLALPPCAASSRPHNFLICRCTNSTHTWGAVPRAFPISSSPTCPSQGLCNTLH